MPDQRRHSLSETERLILDPATGYGTAAVGAQADELGAPIVVDDEFAVDFDEGDPENPLNWSTGYKTLILGTMTTMTILDVIATTSILPGVPELMREFGETNTIYLPLVVSIWELGEGVGPFIVAPMAEMYGRKWPYHVGNCLFAFFSAMSAMSGSIKMLVFWRFITGASISILTIQPSVVGDLFVQEHRGFAMSVSMLAVMLGMSGPALGGWIEEVAGWRWTIWAIVVAVASVQLFSFFVIPETYKVTILQKKAKRLREETGNEKYHSKYEPPNQKNVIKQSMLRPMKMMFLEPIVSFICWYSAIGYGLAYLMGTMMAFMYEEQYHFTPAQTGLVFMSSIVSTTIGTLIYGGLSDRFLKYKARKSGKMRAEDRLVFLLIGSVIFPSGFFVYGWAVEQHWYMIWPCIGSILNGIGGCIAGAAAQGYLIDAYDTYSASALAANVIFKAVPGAIIPLAGPALNGEWLSFGWGNSLMGFVALAFVPFIWLMLIYGDRIRARYSKNLVL